MAKYVVVIASGETERRSLPHLVSYMQDDSIEISVSIPPSNRRLNVSMAENLIKAALFHGKSPDKVVVLVDLDGKEPEEILGPFREDLPGRLRSAPTVNIQYAYAQRHLEAWYFGDAQNLREYFDRQALGNVDTSQPDGIENPKQHLENLLGERVYTALVSEDIASKLDPQLIAQRSPSFRGFLEAVQNGLPPSSEE